MRGHLLVGLTAYRDAHVPVPAEFSKPVCAMCLSRDSWIEMPYYRARADGTATFLTQTNQHLEINIQLDQMGQNFGDWLGMGPGFICHLDRTD